MAAFSVILMGLFFFGIQYVMARTAASGDENVRKMIAGDYRDGWHRY